MNNRKSIKTAILSLAIATAGLWGGLAFAQSDRSITLELFSQKPSAESTALSSVEIQDAGSLAELNAAELASQARYLRVTVNQNGAQEVRVYRVLINPTNGRTFIMSEGKATALDNLLRQGGLEVAKDNMEVTMGAEDIALQVEGLPIADAGADKSAAAPATDTSTASSTSSTATDTSTSTPAASSTATDTSSSTTTTTSTATDTSSSATTTSSTATDTSAASSTASAPADAAASGEPQPLTAEVKQDLGKLALTVLPTSGTAPASSTNSFYLLPIAEAGNPTQSIADDVVTLDYTSGKSMADVSAFYDKLMADQGFEKVADDVANTATENEYIQVYKRGNAIVTVNITKDADKYSVMVDLSDLVQTLEQ